MALLHRTTLTPTKLELLSDWLPDQLWFDGDPTALRQVGAFRFDDPDGQVGVETILLTAGDDSVYQVPLTYRDAPPADSPEALIGTLRHGVLGERWVSDGVLDPVYALALIETILHGRSEASLLVEDGQDLTLVKNDTHVRGSGLDLDDLDSYASRGRVAGLTTRVETSAGTLEVVRQPDPGAVAPERAGILVGTWAKHAEPTLLAALQLNPTVLQRVGG